MIGRRRNAAPTGWRSRWPPLRAHRAILARTAAAILVAALSLSHGLDWFDHAIGDARFGLWHRHPTGRVAVVDIDEASIGGARPWPWDRRVHAALIDELLRLDADSVAFDVDFSAPATPDGDAALEAELKKAEGSVILAALKQPDTMDASRSRQQATLPLPRFAENAWPASVNQWPDGDGRVRAMARSEPIGGQNLPTLAVLLASTPQVATAPFTIDYGIDETAIDHVSANDLLAHRVARERIAGRKVVVGATALEMRDFVEVPRFGSIPGVTLHALAAESLMQGRALHPVSPVLMLLVSGLLLAGATAGAARLKLVGRLLLLAGTAIAGEAAAAAVQNWLPLVPETAPLHGGLLCFALIAVAVEVDDRRIRIVRSRSEADRLRAILDRVIADNFAGIVVVDHDGSVRAISAAAAGIIGLPAGLDGFPAFQEVLPGPLSAACAEALARASDGIWRGKPAREIAFTGPDGRRVTLDCVATLSRVPGPVGPDGRLGPERHAVCLSFADVTEKRAAEARLIAMARVDALTGLANRRVLVEGIEAALAPDAADEAICVALVFFDLDRFKVVNDRLGHAGGDALLVSVADRVRAFAEAGDLVARLGGDEFGLLVSRASVDDVQRFAEGLTGAVGGVYAIGPYEASIGVSVGVAFAAGGDARAMMRNADAAMAAARRDGGDVAVLFDAAMERGAEDDRVLEQDLRDGLRRGEFMVVYQRQVDLATDLVTGVEALARWRHPERGFVSPAKFIPLAERTGLIEALGTFVLREACRDAASWPLPVKVSVNLSAVQLSRGDLVGIVLDALAESGLPPARLELELTESLLMENDGTARDRLDRLRAAGIHLSLDDFGTGFSSLSYLRTFAIDKVKIDQSFVRGLPEDRPAAAIIEAVVSLAGTLGLRVNAEGCETAEQLELLRKLGCDEVQGWFHGRPEPAPAIVASLLAQRDRAEAA